MYANGSMFGIAYRRKCGRRARECLVYIPSNGIVLVSGVQVDVK